MVALRMVEDLVVEVGVDAGENMVKVVVLAHAHLVAVGGYYLVVEVTIFVVEVTKVLVGVTKVLVGAVEEFHGRMDMVEVEMVVVVEEGKEH